MGERLSLAWSCIIVLVLMFLWGREVLLPFYSEVPQPNSTTKQIISNDTNSSLLINTTIDINKSIIRPVMNAETNASEQEPDPIVKTINAYFEKLNRSSRSARSIDPLEENKITVVKKLKKIPHDGLQPHTKDEFEELVDEIDSELERRQRQNPMGGMNGMGGMGGMGGLNMMDDMTSTSTLSPIDANYDEAVDPEILRRGCVPVLPPPPPVPPGTPVGPPPPPLQPSEFPPCPLEGLTTEEPIPAILYRGRKKYLEDCMTDEQIAVIQLGGQSKYPPVPQIESGFKLKGEQVEALTCDRTRGLECFEVSQTPPGGAAPIVSHKCLCMAAFGRETAQRLMVHGKCFIPAGKGSHSDCFENQQGFPLPTGDTHDFKEWNQVSLPCVAGSVCRENSQWFGKRCVCRKKYIQADDGTCSSGISTSVNNIALVSVFIALLSRNLAIQM